MHGSREEERPAFPRDPIGDGTYDIPAGASCAASVGILEKTAARSHA
jgi:hypothetical protein